MDALGCIVKLLHKKTALALDHADLGPAPRENPTIPPYQDHPSTVRGGRMYSHMPPTNPRKRPAPGSSPAAQGPPMQQAFAAPSQLSNADFLRWSQAGGENPNFGDAAAFNMNKFNGSAGMSQPQYDSATPAPSTQLARRPVNRQLVQTAQRATYDNNNLDPWGQFGDESMMDPQNPNGAMEESDSIERLEERAAVAKRDAQSKRKQIPPFVQKLSR